MNVKLNKEELMALITYIYDKTDEILIESPFTPTLADIKFGKEIKLKFFLEDYERSVESGEEKKFLPSRDELTYLFSLAGIFKIKNIQDMYTQIDEFNRRDVFRGQRIGLISFDTNAFPLNVPKLVYEYMTSKRLRNIGIFIPKPVIIELERQWIESRYKISKKSKIKDQKFLKTFLNQLHPNARTFKLCSIYAQKLANQFQVYASSSSVSETGDINIIKDIEKNHQYDHLLITEDSNMEGLAYQHRIQVIKIDGNRGKNLKKLRTRTLEISWEVLRDFIYVLSIYMGKIKISNFEVSGLWNGKEEKDWKNEIVKISTKINLPKIKTLQKIQTIYEY